MCTDYLIRNTQNEFTYIFNALKNLKIPQILFTPLKRKISHSSHLRSLMLLPVLLIISLNQIICCHDIIPNQSLTKFT